MTPGSLTLRRCRGALGVLGALILASSAAGAQASDSVASRPLATRAELEALAVRLATDADSTDARLALRAQVERRLRDGDFRPGDRILIEVQGEPTLTDTFTVGADANLLLPSPAVGALSLRGVLRAEAPARVTECIARFVNAPVVRVRPLIRVAIEGEVSRPGFYAVPADATLSDALMAAHGLTAAADLRKVRLARDGRTRFDATELRTAMARGWTLDDALVRDGDALVVGRGRGDLEGRLRFMWVVVSLAGGIYGLTRAF